VPTPGARVSPVSLGPLLPAVTVAEPDDARWLVEVLAECGYTSVEITLRTSRALEAIGEAVRVAPPGFTVGAGTVIDPQQVDDVAALGAGFVVTPGYSGRIVAACRDAWIDVIPGIGGATDAMRAIGDEVTRVKVFPARELGGPAFVDALSAPFPRLQFLPSGGVSASDAARYLSIPAVFAVSGSWMLSATTLRDRNRDAALASCRAALDVVAGSRGQG
jgi:2-dehydro-3-deoxyphosphogluconate aldolase/(4S)-4-hydroxy-2-oxoglutarate aldolase